MAKYWGWGSNGYVSNAISIEGDQPSERFWKFVNDLYEVRFSGNTDIDPTSAFSYFGYKITEDRKNDYDSYGHGYPNDGYINKDYSGMSARPEWAPIDRELLGHRIISVEAALKDIVQNILNVNDRDGIMADIEKRHLLVTIEGVRLELADAPFANKSNLKGLSEWLSKLALKAGESYLSGAMKESLAEGIKRIDELVKVLVSGAFKLPW